METIKNIVLICSKEEHFTTSVVNRLKNELKNFDPNLKLNSFDHCIITIGQLLKDNGSLFISCFSYPRNFISFLTEAII